MLTQTEADALMAMGKAFQTHEAISLHAGVDATRELLGDDQRERFLLDLWRGTLRLSKLRFQTRARRIIVLARLDINGSPHTNPDGTKLGRMHLHVFRDGYEDRWAYPIDPATFKNLQDPRQALLDFCGYCNIRDLPPIQEGLL